MKQLSDIIINLSAEHKLLLSEFYRIPSITAYNRLEPRARSENFERSLRAEIRDPLWMLTRQWQMGELEAEDCGSPIDARLATREINIDRIALSGNEGKQYDENIPMEAYVEKETVEFTHSLKLQAGLYFLKLHTETLRDKYISKYRDKFGIDQDPAYQERFKDQADAFNLYNATRSAGIDGKKIMDAIVAGSFITIAGIEAADETAIRKWGDALLKWFTRQYYQPGNTIDNAWRPEQLEYQFKVAAPDSEQTQIVLTAEEYYNGRLDWFSFDNVLRPQPITLEQDETPGDGSSSVDGEGVDSNGPGTRRPNPDGSNSRGRDTNGPNPNGANPDNPAGAPKINEKVISFIPVTPSFKGIPAARFWEMEDRQVDFGKMNMKTTDHLLMLFTEFGLIYANDWFMIPYKMAVNTLCEIKAMVIEDVFGDRTLVEAAGSGVNDWENWSMFTLSNKNNIGSYNRQFFLPAALTQQLESDPVEKVNFIRDEMSNMCWGIESIIPDQNAGGIDGDLAADKTGVIPEEPAPDATAMIRYLLGTTVPENWIPFIPVHKPGSVQDIRFQRASMPKLGSPPMEVIKAKGKLLTEAPSPYYINEEEISYAGIIVERKFQRTRWLNGKTYCWLGRNKKTGRGQGASNLKFDQVLPVK